MRLIDADEVLRKLADAATKAQDVGLYDEQASIICRVYEAVAEGIMQEPTLDPTKGTNDKNAELSAEVRQLTSRLHTAESNIERLKKRNQGQRNTIVWLANRLRGYESDD